MQEIGAGIAWLPVSFVNVYMVSASDGSWTLVDTGLPGRAEQVKAAATSRFGGRPPQAIVLTHGHFDHSGSALELADAWDVPIYAHRLELPYITGKSPYPQRDPTVGGFLAFLSRFFPSTSADLSSRVQELPANGVTPGLADWEWHFTPGHSPGHISLFRRSDKALIAGDAFATGDFDSAFGAITKRQTIARGGTPYNYNWPVTWRSVAHLAGLEPQLAACGHGVPMQGEGVAHKLRNFAHKFQPPHHGRYILEPAVTDENGVVSLPPPATDPLPGQVAAIGAAVAAAMIWRQRASRRDG